MIEASPKSAIISMLNNEDKIQLAIGQQVIEY